MKHRLVITGTDTGLGKTVFAAALTDALGAFYWKPVQAGLDGETDRQVVQRLGRIPARRILDSAYELTQPVSPHLSARLDGEAIDPQRLKLPTIEDSLVIEGAGGLLVPLSDQVLFADIFARWQVPVILCARTTLGTINHTLLSLEAMRLRRIPVLGIVFVGDENKDSERTIVGYGGVPSLGRLPWLAHLTPAALRQAFSLNFAIDDFRKLWQ